MASTAGQEPSKEIISDETTSNTQDAPPLTLLDDAPPFHQAKHTHYVETLADQLDGSFEGALTNHLRLSGVYWSVCTMFLLCGDDLEKVNDKMGLISAKDGKESIVDWVASCYDEKTGAYGGDTGQEGHVLYTLSALQILAMADCLDRVDKQKVVQFIAALQQANGSFVGDAAGEVDTRFSYCALSALSLLNRLGAISLENAIDFLQQCHNPLDGGYGSCVGAESHAGQVFCCIGALSIAKALPENSNKLAWWLSERQCDSGGLNGRPEKQADVCYSWWILSSMSILGIQDYIDGKKLAAFILKAQDPDDGGIADRPDDMADVFHTFFGISGLSLLGYLPPQFAQIDPVYALPVSVVKRLGLQAEVFVKSGKQVEERLQGYNVVEQK